MCGCYGNVPRYHFLRPIILKAGSDIPQTYALETYHISLMLSPFLDNVYPFMNECIINVITIY